MRGDAETAARLAERGVRLDDGVVKPTDITIRNLRRGVWELAMTIREGKTHEVRRLCEALDLEVLGLLRTKFGPVDLGDLPTGATRPMLSRERKVIDAIAASAAAGRPSTRPRS